MRRAIVVGSEGQDGQLLTQRLTADGWHVIGIGRARVTSSKPETDLPGTIDTASDVEQLMEQMSPDVVFYVAAHHQASESSLEEELDGFERSYAVHVRRLLQFLAALSRSGRGTLFYAGSSLVFGNPDEHPQTETTPFRPRSAYAITKAAGIHACQYYREHHGVKASTGILYNHESPLRRESFVSQKIVRAVARIAAGSHDTVALGDLNAKVDWGYAPDFVDAMARIANLPQSGDFVVATGTPHSVRQFAEIAFARAGLNWRDHVTENRSMLTRSSSMRVGDASLLRATTGWSPTVSFEEMVGILVDAAIRAHEA